MGLSEGEDCGLERPGSLAPLWSPPSVRSILCAPAEPLLSARAPPQSCRRKFSPMLLASHNILLLPGSGRTDFSAAEGETVLSGQFTGSVNRESS